MAHALYDTNLRFLRVNEAFARLTGIAVDAHAGQTLWDVVPGIPPALIQAYRAVLSDGEPLRDFHYVVPTPRAPGGYCYRRANAFPVRDGQGVVTRLVVTIEELTPQILTEQAREASEARTRRLQDLTSALSSAVTVHDVHQLVLQEASRALGAYAATLIVPIDEDTLFVAGGTGYSDDVLTSWRRFSKTGRFPVVDAIRERRAIFLPTSDLSQSYPDMVPLLKPNTRAVAAVPLIANDRVLAALTLSFDDEQVITEENQAFSRAVVQQAAQALERARLYDEQRRAHDRAALLARVGETLAASLDVRVTLERITALTIEHVADWCAIYQPAPHFDDLPIERQRLLLVAVAHHDPTQIDTLRAMLHFPSDPASPISNEHVYRTGTPLLVPALPPEAIDAIPEEERRAMTRSLGLHSLITVPLVANGRKLGVLGVATSSSDRTLTHDDLLLTQELAHRAALALDLAQLYEAAALSEQRHRSLVEATSQIVWVRAPSGEFVADQPGWRTFTGQTEEQLLGWGWLNAVHPEDRPRVRRTWQDALESQALYTTEQRLRRHDGQYRVMHVRATPVRTRDGAIREWVGAQSDITERVQAEQQVRDSEARHRALVEHAAVGIVRTSPRGELLDVNPAAEKILGYSREELLRMTFMDFTYPEDGGEAGMSSFRRLMRGEIDAFNLEKRYVRKDGRVVWANLSGSAVRDEQGAPLYSVSIFEDITERKRAEARLRESEERFRRLVDASPTGIAVGASDGTLHLPNDAYLRMLGFTREEYEAGALNWTALTPPEYAEVDARAFRQVFAQGTSEPYEKEMLRRDGTRVPVGLVLARYDQHDETFVVGYVQDLSVQKAAERALREHGLELERRVEERTRTLAERTAALDAFVRFAELASSTTSVEDLTRHAVEVLRATVGPVSVAYYERRDHVWKAVTWSDDIPAEALAMIRAGIPVDQPTFSEAVQGRRAYYMEAWNAEREGLDDSRMYGAGALYPFYSGEEPVGLLNMATMRTSTWSGRHKAIFRAVGRSFALALERSEQTRQLQERTRELERSNAELERFAYVASHDLQEPLRTIASYSELLAVRYGSQMDDKGRLFLKFMTEGAQRMKVLIDDLLVFSRLNSVREPLRTVDANRPLSEASSRLQALIEQAGARVESERLPFVLGDEGELTQLFQNLIGNAVKFRRSDEPPVVRVTARAEDAMWHFTVADNGIGIEPQYQERVFGLFQRLHTRSEYDGTGLGLSIVRKVAERHGGRAWLESNVGIGTTVHFTLCKAEGGHD